MTELDYRMALVLQNQFQQESKPNNKNDLQMALLLQEQFKHESNVENPTNNLVYNTKQSKNKDNTKSLIDPSWELVDPTPNVHNLFIAFNENFFWNKLLAVCVSWSKRMTTCAGICSYQGRGGLCSITLSEPLLKLRPRKDLVETLLHEMIHAYLFVTHNNKDRDGHGPEFHKHMYRINGEAGTNITVYHDFHDEVRLYKQHWWRCDGPCQKWKPYFGMVRRAMNRAPGPNDRWWGEHSRSCGGNFIKVKEPEKPVKKSKSGKENKPANPNTDIRNFFPKNDNKFTSSSPIKNNIIDLSKDSSPIKSRSTKFNDNTNIKNIHGFHDVDKLKKSGFVKGGTTLNAGTIVINKTSTITKPEEAGEFVKPKPFSNSGHILGSKEPAPTSYSTVRNHWINKFEKPSSNKRLSDEVVIIETPKRSRRDSEPLNDYVIFVNCPVCKLKIAEKVLNEHLDNCLKDTVNMDNIETCFNCNKKISKKDYQDHLSKCLENEDFDELFDDDLTECEICNQQIKNSIIKEHMKTCLQNVSFNIGNETLVHKTCDICNMKINENIYDRHIESCLLKMYDDMEKKIAPKETVLCLVCNEKIIKNELDSHLDECMSEAIFAKKTTKLNKSDMKSNSHNSSVTKIDCSEIFANESEMNSFLNDNSLMEESENSENDKSKLSENDKTESYEHNKSGNYQQCPVCFKNVLESDINQHLDLCLSK